MKKYLGLVFILMLLLTGGTKTTRADDGGPSTVFWVIDQKVNCISLINPEIPGSFLVFDYSEKVGQALGKPWTVIEKGKCYQIDDGTESIYAIKSVNGTEQGTFINYSLYKPTDNVQEIFCKDFECKTTTLGQEIKKIELFGDISVTVSQEQAIHFTGINTDQLFPTKYAFGYPVTSFSSVLEDNLKPIINDPSFIEATKLYTSLAEELNTTLSACDGRVRVERQYTLAGIDVLDLYIKNIVWRLASGQDVITQTAANIPTSYKLSDADVLYEIDSMGCKPAYSAFIQKHAADWATIDRLAEEVIAKFPSVTKSSGIDPTIRIKNASEVAKIESFIENTDNTPVPVSEQVTNPTTLDEPTPEKKTDMLLNSSNPFMRIYVWLPILALIGIFIFLVSRKKR